MELESVQGSYYFTKTPAEWLQVSPQQADF